MSARSVPAATPAVGTTPLVAGPISDVGRSLELLVVSVLVLVAVALVLGGWWMTRRVRRSPGVRFQRMLADYDDVTVLMHPNPDPDAMSCAMAVDRIADSVDTTTTLQYAGEIRHQENRAFRTVLGLEVESIETRSQLASDAVVLVDHNTPRGFSGAQSIEPVAVVDHHPGNGTGTTFTDVRTAYGAASTILVEYLLEIGATMAGTDEASGFTVSPELATGLLYGIQSDTNHLTSGCSRAEFDAAASLFPGIDEGLLERIANPQVSDDVLQVKATAITDKRVDGPFAVCDVGEIATIDAIPQAADELMLLEGITAVVVYGEHDGTVHLSGRSRDERVHMGETLRHAISDIPMASAGGHERMGGGQLSVEHMKRIGPSDGSSREEFEDRLFSALAGER